MKFHGRRQKLVPTDDVGEANHLSLDDKVEFLMHIYVINGLCPIGHVITVGVIQQLSAPVSLPCRHSLGIKPVPHTVRGSCLLG